MRRLLALGVLLALGLAAPRPAAARIVGRNAEISIGREAAAAVEKFFPVDRDPVAVARVRQIGRRLAVLAPDPDFPFEFHVVESPEVNAFALPGGFIYVFRGLLQLVPNDDALAFVLAHEVGHVVRRHAVRQFEKNLLLGAGIAAILAGTGASSAWGQAADVVQAIVGLSFTRSDEREADTHGLELMAAAGYHPRAALEAMAIVKRAAGDEKSVPALLRTHPAPEARMKALAQQAEALLARRTEAAATRRELPATPTLAEPRLPGLEGLRLAPCSWWPLEPGAVWTYRLRRDGEERPAGTLTVRLLERLVARPEGVCRLELDWGGGVTVTRLVAAAGERLVSAPEGGASTWRLEGLFAGGPERDGDSLVRFAGTERVRVPAGEFEVARVERLGEGDAPTEVVWFARGVGPVRRLYPRSGMLQELVTFRLPDAGPAAPAR